MTAALVVGVGGWLTAGVATPVTAPLALVANPTAALAGADRFVEQQSQLLFASPGERYAARGVTGSPQGLQYVTYDRQYQGLPVFGGDFTVVTDQVGAVRSAAVAQSQPIQVATTPTVPGATAVATSRGQVAGATEVVGPVLSVYAVGNPALAWETIVSGPNSRKHVFVDAASGKVLRAFDETHAEVGEGNGYYNGPKPLAIDTTLSGSTYSMKDPLRSGVSCADISNNTIYSGSDNKWGNGGKLDKETGCVDSLYAAQKEWDMLKSWYGRDGIDGQGKGFQIRVGLQEANAYWTGGSAPYVKIGYNSAKAQWLDAMDVIGHEFGHGLDQYTGAGSSADTGEAGLGEATGDIFGALTEAYTNEPAEFDPPDFETGEEVDFSGNGKPLRYMYDPSKDGRSPNCWSTSIPNTEVHDAAGPLNHWFYLLAIGSARSGYPTSPTCNQKAVAGLGDIKKAGAIFYNAMLAKTTNMTHKKYRTLTLQSAKNIDSTCVQFKMVQEAWDAVSIPAQSGDPTCTPGTTPTASPSSSPTASPTTSPTGGPSGSAPDIKVDNVKAHLNQLQTIATNNSGNRRAGSAGYTASVAYLEQKLKDAGYTVTRQTCTSGCFYQSDNLIADWPGGDANQVIMLGAHLDGVAAGPGINDNGSGSAALLENALALAAANPNMAKHVRFAWWTDEEQGLNGSKFYVNNLTSTQKSAIKAYYNFDMVASTNGGYFVNNITTTVAKPLKDYWTSLNLAPEENTEGAGRSDDYSFSNAGIPSSGYATGAGAKKSSSQQQKWGGTSGSAYDPCYHAACDKYPANINDTALNRAADGIAYTIWNQAVTNGPGPTTSPTASPSTSPTNSPSPSSSPTNGPATVTVTNPGNQFGFVNFQSFPVQIRATASNGGSLTYSATGLPPGLSINATGSITGTPTTAGTYTVTVTAQLAGGGSGTTTFQYQIHGF
ncbi:M20/M25/M40 family metallo-hydrolase [Longispora sp. NPDC051575]|uniref:M20/M25/M40 family metallo-hydrolase n=1 Tax=Longispora sp. NPDC051575 TaxID=3154943 RepID=UPI003422A5E8